MAGNSIAGFELGTEAEGFVQIRGLLFPGKPFTKSRPQHPKLTMFLGKVVIFAFPALLCG
jgi:hypothetical protein